MGQAPVSTLVRYHALLSFLVTGVGILSTKGCFTTTQYEKEFVHKIVLITDMLLTFFFNGKEVIFPFLKHDRMWKLLDLQRALYEFETLHPCPGMLDRSLCSSLSRHRNVENSHGTELRSLKCKTSSVTLRVVAASVMLPFSGTSALSLSPSTTHRVISL